MDVRQPRSFVRRIVIAAGLGLAGGSLVAAVKWLVDDRGDSIGGALWPRFDRSLPSAVPPIEGRVRSYGVVWDHAA